MNTHSAAGAPPAIVLREVKYSLPEMLNELKAERSLGALASEKLDQAEIGKLFKPKTPRRVKSK
ncbi:MAG TPA: hypothetical protein VHO24_10100 [Opitutaceae bacterium]|nr:hypothetical protein [Opitutaceae bacterium]